MVDILNAFNNLVGKDAEGYNVRTPEVAPENEITDVDVNETIAESTLNQEPIGLELKEAAETIQDASLSAVETVLNNADALTFEQIETDFLETALAAFDEEGELDMETLSTHVVTEDSHAFDALATSPEAQRYRRYLEENGYGSVRTGPAGKNDSEKAIQRQMVNQALADKMATDMQRLSDIGEEIASLEIDIEALRNELNALQLREQQLLTLISENKGIITDLEEKRADLVVDNAETTEEEAVLREKRANVEAEHKANIAAVEFADGHGGLDEAQEAINSMKLTGQQLEGIDARLADLRDERDIKTKRIGEIDTELDSRQKIGLQYQEDLETNHLRQAETNAEISQKEAEIARLREEQASLQAEGTLSAENDGSSWWQNITSLLSGYEEDQNTLAELGASETETLNKINNFNAQNEALRAEREELQARVDELQLQLDEALNEYHQAASDYANDGAADLASSDFTEMYSDALTINNENGTAEFKIMASYDESGNQTGILVSDGRLAIKERATQPAIPLDQYSAEDQAHIMAALAEAEANGEVTLVDGNAFNEGLERSREVSAAIVRNEQYDSTYGRMMPGTSRLEAAAQGVEILEEELAAATSVSTAAAADGEGIQADTELTGTFAHAGEPRDEPLDRPEPTTDYTNDGTVTPTATAPVNEQLLM